MSVFIIRQPGVAPATLEKVEKATEVPGEASKLEGSEVAGQEQTLSAEEAEKVEPIVSKSGKADIMIKVDGPVGRIFTDALNKVLVNESYMTMMPHLTKKEAPVVDPESGMTGDNRQDEDYLQVYAWDVENLNMEDVVHITNEVTRHTDRTFVIAVESTGKVTNAMSLLDGLGKCKNVTMCYSQVKAAEAVKARVLK